jgi:hypothetical protein
VADETAASTQIEAVWAGVDEVAPVAANQFLCQFAGEGEAILTFGHVSPPVLRGSPEERLDEARRISSLPIHVVGRFGLTRVRLEELRLVVEEALGAYDRASSDAPGG